MIETLPADSKPKKKQNKTLQRCVCGFPMVKTDGEHVFLKAKNYRIVIGSNRKEAQCQKCNRWHGIDEPTE